LTVSVDDNSDGLIQFMVRPDGDAFYSGTGALPVSGPHTIDYSHNGYDSGPSFSAGTDIDVTGKKLAGGTCQMACMFHLVLIPD